MGYMHLSNLYRDKDILLFRQCYALEKIHGCSAHISYKDGQIRFFSGGATHSSFVALFDEAVLLEKFKEQGLHEVTIYGEAYGGKEQGMSAVYGKVLKFIVFDVEIAAEPGVESVFISVPQMEKFAIGMGLEVVSYELVSTDLASLDAQRDRPSVQAERNGMGNNHPREGVVLRPLIEVRKNNNERVMSKHKSERFNERATPVKIIDPERMAVLAGASAIADEWVTMNRLKNILSHFAPEEIDIKFTPKVIGVMIDDVIREAAGEIVDSKDARKAIGKRAAELFKLYFQEKLRSTETKV